MSAAVVRAGATLGRYVLGEVLGQGAMATVFRARDTTLGRTVAVKVMSFALAARTDAAERFRREAQAVAALKHPGIVEIYDFVPGGGGEPSYIVVELIEGPTLRTVLEERRGRLLPEIAAVIGAELAEALAVAHERGIVHRDVKPDNVMLERGAAASRVVITDFGVAHVTGLETMTATGALVGSPAYMSPEQAKSGDVCPAVDVWATGALLYEMATSCVPFPGRDPFAVVASILRGTFKRPSQVTALVGPAYETVVLRCLKTDPSARYPTARSLAEDLRAIAKEAGLGDARVVLRRLLQDPEGLERELRPRVAELAVERARKHGRRGELAKAFAEISRATAYVPEHAGATALLRSLQSRRRWLKVVAVAAGVGACASAALFARPYLKKGRPERTIPAEAPAGAAAAAPQKGSVVVAAGGAAAPSAPAPPTAAPPTEGPGSAAESAPEKRRRRVRAARLADGTATPSEPPPRQGEGTAPTEAAPPTAPAAPARDDAPAAPAPGGYAAAGTAPGEATALPPATEAPKPGRVRLNVPFGLCDPTIDERRPSGSVVSYDDVAPGTHAVHCWEQGKRHLVGIIVVEAGRVVAKTIVKDASGKISFKAPR